MDSEDVQLLYTIGQVTIVNIAALVSQSILYGIYLAIFALTMRCLLRRRPLTTQTLAMLIILFLLFTIATFSLVTFIIFNVIQIRFALLENTELSLAERVALSNQRAALWEVLTNWLSYYGLTVAVADAVLVWRACVLWPNNKIIKFSLIVLLTITFALSVAAGVVNTISTEQTAAIANIFTTLSNDLMIAMTASTLLTNITATAMITVKTYQHRKMMKETHGIQRSKTLIVLTFLAESGVAYCALQVIYAGTQIPDNTYLSTLDYAALIYSNIFWVISCMYPSLVFLVIHYNHSLAVHTGVDVNSSFERHIPTRGIDDAGTHVSFAHNAPSHLEMGTTDTSSHRDEEREGSVLRDSTQHPSEK